MPYYDRVYCRALRSKTVTNKFFCYISADSQGNTNYLPENSEDNRPAIYYDNVNKAIAAAEAFDTAQLPLFVNNTIIKFFYSNGSTYTEASIAEGHYGALDSDNKTAVPHCAVINNVTTDTQINTAKGAKNDVKNLYSISEKIQLTKPSGYSDAVFAELLINLNNVFGIDLPTAAGTYIYDKITGTWKKQTT